MTRKLLLIIIFIIIISGAGLVWSSVQQPDSQSFESNLVSLDDFELPSFGFIEANTDYEWSFPDDFAPHPEYQRELWRLDSACSERFSIEFERVTIVPQVLTESRTSEWAIDKIITATLQFNNETFTKVSRTSLELAGTSEARIWVENWFLDWIEGELTINTGNSELSLNFLLSDATDVFFTNGWLSYQRQGDGTLDNKSCTLTFSHRFGTPS